MNYSNSNLAGMRACHDMAGMGSSPSRAKSPLVGGSTTSDTVLGELQLDGARGGRLSNRRAACERTSGQMDGRSHGRADERADGRTDGRTDGRADAP